jgi:hypothetical protein
MKKSLALSKSKAVPNDKVTSEKCSESGGSNQ